MLRTVIAILALSVSAAATCHAVTPSGTGTHSGADWNNAFNGIPSSLVRGDVYYLSDGSYPLYVADTATGAGTVTIRKAVSSDHCTDTGWNLGTMGSSQAVFAGSGASNFGVGFRFRISNLTLDGSSRSSISSGHGIKIDGSVCDASSTFCWTVTVGDTGSVSTDLMQYVEIVGSGANDTANLAHPDQNISFRGGDHLTCQFCYIHDSSGDPVELVAGVSNFTFTDSYILRNDSTSTNHGECAASNGSVSHVVYARNVLADCEGTAFIDALNSGGATTDDDWQIYDNVFLYTSGNSSNRNGVGDGAIACAGNGVSQACTNWKIYHNTFLNVGCGGSPTPTGTGGVIWQGGVGTTGTPDIRDNFFWNNCLTTSISVPGGSTIDYNSCLGPNDNGSCTGAHSVNTATVTPTPFVNWTTGNFNLASDNANWNNFVSLGSPYDTDAAGNSFTTDRGAFQISGISSTPSLRMLLE